VAFLQSDGTTIAALWQIPQPAPGGSHNIARIEFTVRD